MFYAQVNSPRVRNLAMLCLVEYYVFRFWFPYFSVFVRPWLFVATQNSFTLLLAWPLSDFSWGFTVFISVHSGLKRPNAQFKRLNLLGIRIALTLGISWRKAEDLSQLKQSESQSESIGVIRIKMLTSG